MVDQLIQIQNMNQRMTWYQEAKFGLFIHWGAYSVAGVEASWPIMAPELSEVMFGTKTGLENLNQEAEYTTLPGMFNPVDFDAETWVRTAQAAGMRYMVITTKHHDGFCMFDAPGTDYKITNTPYGKDICLELAQACAEVGMPLGFYYSPPDMHHPGYRDTSKPATTNWLGEPKRKEWGGYLDYMESHIRKLLTGYGKVSILWFDGLVNHPKFDPPRFHKLIHELSPDTLINDRLGDDYDFITPEQFIPKKGIPVRTGKPPSGNDPGGDFLFRAVTFLFKVPGIRGFIRTQLQKYTDGKLELTPVLQEPYPSPDRFQPWETCMTMGKSWAHNPNESAWKPPGKLVQNLVEVVSRGGNYLLNVGPTARGTFPPEAVERLHYVGKWMDTYHEAIYGSTYTSLQGLPWGQATRKGNKIYLHVFDWPSVNKLELTAFPGSARTVSLFSGEPLAFTQREQHLEITLPPQAPDADASVLVVDIDGTEKGWSAYSPEMPTKIALDKYLRTQVINSAWINSLINGLLAFLTYPSRATIPFAEAAIDILLTVAIIAFLVSWIAVGLARQEIAKGNLSRPEPARHRLRLPQGSALRALIITVVCVIGFGGLFMDGLLYLLSPGGLNNWVYIVVKILYTGACAALAAYLAIRSVIFQSNHSVPNNISA